MHIQDARETKQDIHRGGGNDGTNSFQAMCIFMTDDSKQFSGVWNDLKNNTLLGTDYYPKTLTAKYDVLC